MPNIKPSPEQIKSWIFNEFPDHKLARRGEEIRIHNPFHLDTKYHLWINVKKAKVHDFRPSCQTADGSFLWFVKKYKQISFHAAIKEVMGDNVDPRILLYDKSIEEVIGSEEDEVKHIDLPDGFVKLDESISSSADTVRRYLNNRLINDEQISAFGIGHCGFDVIFPYYEYGEVVYWQSRSILNKTFNFPPDTSKSKFLYGFDNIEPYGITIITESIFNSLMFRRGCAIGGSDLSENQKRRLKASGVKDIIFAFDSDDSGFSGVIKAYNQLHNKFNLYYSMTYSDNDWNDIAINFGINECMKLLKQNTRKLDIKEIVKLKLQT